MKKILSLLFLLANLVVAQVQIGQDLDGETAGDQFGRSVSLSSDGTVIAIGGHLNDGNGNNSGHVRIYENQSGTWVQVGQDVDGEAVGDSSGWSVSLSSNGSIVAIGARDNDGNGSNSGHVRIYENQGGTWLQVGLDIDGEVAEDASGWNISLSSDGTVVAIGSILNDGNGSNSGHVRVYENQSGTWVKIGQDIDGEVAGDVSGGTLSLSSDGSIVAIGAYRNDGNGSNSGHARIYENQSGTWVQLGLDIDGEAIGDESGFSVSLSSDGSIVAIGAYKNDANGEDSGQVRVYENQNGTWVQVGQDIDGEAAFDGSGQTVSLSSDGSIVAIRAISNDGNGSNSGHVRIYENQNGIWVQIGQDIDGEAVNDFSGSSISLSSDGTIVAIGAVNNDGNGSSSGHVRIYDLSAVLATESFNVDYFSYYPNPVKDVLNLNLNAGLELKQVNLYNSLGQYVYSSKTTTIDTSNLTSGLYFIEVETNKGKSSKRLIKD